MPTPKLKPCPWGGKGIVRSYLGVAYRVVGRCDTCTMKEGCRYSGVWEHASWSNDRAKAVAAWNRRAPVVQGENRKEASDGVPND